MRTKRKTIFQQDIASAHYRSTDRTDGLQISAVGRKVLKGLPDIIPTEQTSALPSSAPADALEIPVMQSRTGGQLIKRKGYTLSYNADYKTPQWVAWELTGKETKERRKNRQIFARPRCARSESI